MNYKIFSFIFMMLTSFVFGTEFTFELPDNKEQCFYEVITSNTSCTFEFQVSCVHCFFSLMLIYFIRIFLDEHFLKFLLKNLFFKCCSQVLSGGQYDIDVIIEGPSQKLIYKEIRKEYDTFIFNVTVSIERLQLCIV